MLSAQLDQLIQEYTDFPKKGILFRDALPILQNVELFSDLIESMSTSRLCKEAEAIISIDARGFIFGSAIALKLSKPMIVARKPGKLPGKLLKKSYQLEYGSNELCIQESAIEKFKTFVIVDDLLATGGTVKCVSEILSKAKKNITGLCVVIELTELNGQSKLSFPVKAEISY